MFIILVDGEGLFMNKKVTKIMALTTTLFASGCDFQVGVSDGPVWLDGVIAPTNDQGKDGDFYLDTVTQKIYKKTDGEWKVVSEINKENGDIWLSGESAPSNEVGEDGNFYFDTQAEKIYKKENGAWALKTFVGQREVEKIELIEVGVEYDVYKITYTNGESETFNSIRDDSDVVIDEEGILDAYVKAYNRTILLDQYTISSNDDSYRVTYNNGKIYGYGNGKEVQSIKDELLNRYVIYRKEYTSATEFELYSEISNEANEYFENFLVEETELVLSLNDTKEHIKIAISEDLIIERENVNIEVKAEIKNGKYQITVKGEGNKESVTETLEIKYVFDSHIEKVVFNYSSIGGDATANSESVYYIDDVFDKTMEVTDFSEYPDPIKGTFSAISEQSREKANGGFTVRQYMNGELGPIQTGNISRRHFINSATYESHYINVSNNVWENYSKYEDSMTIQERKDDAWVENQTLLYRMTQIDFDGFLEGIITGYEMTNDVEQTYTYSIVDGELVIEVITKDLYIDEENGERYKRTLKYTFETTNDMEYFDKFVLNSSGVQVDNEGNIMDNGKIQSGDTEWIIEYSIDMDIVNAFNPDDYTAQS